MKVVFWDEEAIAPNTVDYVRRVSQDPRVDMKWLCLPITHINACSREHPHWACWDQEAKDLWCRELPTDDCVITEADLGYKFARAPFSQHIHTSITLCGVHEGTVGLMLGLRADESLSRYRSVAKRQYLNYISPCPSPYKGTKSREEIQKAADKMGVMDVDEWLVSSRSATGHGSRYHFVKPIYDWTSEDVWTAPKNFGWDHNTAYADQARAGISLNDQRVATPWAAEPLRGLYMYSECYPDLFEKMLKRVPGCATAHRYGRTALYGYGGIVGWDRNTNDPEALIEQALKAWPDNQRDLLRDRIELEISRHYSKERDTPIPLEEEGFSGVTWKFLYMLAVRGDPKGRKVAMGNKIDPNKPNDEKENQARA